MDSILTTPPKLRAVDDIPAIRRNIYDQTLDAATRMAPITNQLHTLTLKDPHYADGDTFSIQNRKDAILQGRTLGRRLRGTWELADNATGQVLDRRTSTLAVIPHLTDHGTFILNGSAYTLAHQSRLRPGIYARKRASGETEAHVNVLPGSSLQTHRIVLDPESGILKLNVRQAEMPLLPYLRALGATDQQLRASWGDEVLRTNAPVDHPRHLARIYERLLSRPEAGLEPAQQQEALRKAVQDTKLDTSVMGRTLRHPYGNLSLDAYLAASKKVLAVFRGDDEEDDRDHPAYQQVMGPEDLIAERFNHAARHLRNMLRKATFKKSLQAIPAGALDRAVRGAFLETGLGQALEEIGPADVLDQVTRISRLGEGAISDPDAAPDDARSVHTGQLGFIDTVRTPESLSAGLDLRLAGKTFKGTDGRLYSAFRNVRTGKEEKVSPQDLSDKTVAFPGELQGQEPWIRAIHRGKLDYVRRDQVDYEMPPMEHTFNHLANLVPLKSSSKGQRVSMGARMAVQALPLTHPEAPHLQTGVPGQPGSSYEQLLGRHMGSVQAAGDGKVTKVDEHGITVQYRDGTTQTHDLYNYFPLNRKSFLHNRPVVKVGDPVQAGQTLAASNFTDDAGTTALGTNLRVAYLPYRGHNIEDAWVISRSAAEKKLAADMMYQHELEWTGQHRRGKKAFMSLFPAAYDRQTLANFDDDGLIQRGTKVEYGSPLILAAKEREKSHNQVGRGSKSSFQDETVTWQHHTPGVVTDVVQTPKGALVTVRSSVPVKVGDKLSGRHGNKGVVAKIVEDHLMPRGADGKPFELLNNPLGVITRCYDEQTEFLTEQGWKFGRDVTSGDRLVCYHPWTGALHIMAQLAPFHVADYRGPMIAFRNKVMDFCVTPNHRFWTRCSYKNAPWQEETAERIYAKHWSVPVAGQPVPGVDQDFVLPPLEYHVKDTQSEKGEIVIPASLWAAFLGWYLSEGNTTYQEPTDNKITCYRVHISQSWKANPDKCAAIQALLERLPFSFHYSRKNQQFHITSKRLASYCRQFGWCREKHIPEWVFQQSFAVREAFLSAYWLGDGSVRYNRKGGKVNSASSRSRRMADDLQRLWLYQGLSASAYPAAIGHDGDEEPMWVCSVHQRRERALAGTSSWRRVNYCGRVYCPTVPTGYVVTRRNGRVLIAGNTNPSQVVEVALGKIAARTGQPYRPVDFQPGQNWAAYARKELQKHNLKDTEDVDDPETGVRIPNILTGTQYFMRLHHTAEGKSSGRGASEGYTLDAQPAKGGASGAKRLSLADINAIISHGAVGVLKDRPIRGQKNLDWWAAFMEGRTPPSPTVPPVHRKFLAFLQAAGVNPLRRGHRTQLLAMTDRDVDELAGNRELRNADTVDYDKGLKPVPGGLFDEGLTAGHGGKMWSKITLAEAMPSPVFEEPIRRVLGLTAGQFEDVLAGREKLGGRTGPEAFQNALGAIKLDEAVRDASARARNQRGAKRDQAIRQLGYLRAAQETGLHPRDWLLSKVPVLPPLFRPVAVMQQNNRPLVADANFLYRDLFDANQSLKGMQGRVADIGAERLALYRSLKAVVGLGDPVTPAHVEKNIRGMLQHVFGNNPKFSWPQRKLFSGTVDTVGRSVIAPDPDLDMDEVALPENQAWDVFRPFVIRHLSRHGVSPLEAARQVKDRTPLARRMLLQAMQERPVIAVRAPVLHRYSTMAFRPRLAPGDTLRLNSFVLKGYGADFDGDTMSWHVPVSDDAVRDAVDKMLPSRNLLSVRNFKAHQLPINELAAGLYQASTATGEGPELTFATTQDALRAYRQGRIRENARVRILEHS